MAKVKLIKAQPKHTQFIYDLYCREQVLRGHGLHRNFPAPWWKSVIEGLIPGWEHCFLIAQGAAYLGHAGFQDYSKEDKRAEIALAVVPEMQNKGLGTGAMKCLVELAKLPCSEGGLGLGCLYASIIEDNFPSRKLFERYGFHHNGNIPNYYRFGSKRLCRTLYVKTIDM